MAKEPRKPRSPSSRQVQDGITAPRPRRKKAAPVEAPVADAAVIVSPVEAPVSVAEAAPGIPVEPFAAPEVPASLVPEAKQPGFLKRLSRFFLGKSK